MTLTTPAGDLHLPARGLLVVPDAAGVEFRCLSGTLWLTIDDDVRDIVLEPGERFRVGVHRRAIVYALNESAVRLHESPAAVESDRTLLPRRRSPTLSPAGAV